MHVMFHLRPPIKYVTLQNVFSSCRACRGHSDEWYQERCVFCAECKTSVNSTYQKRGTRCHGCRRWFHNTCMPPENSSSCKSSNQQRNQEGSITAAMATGDPAESRSTGAGGSERHTPGPFFHTDSCREVSATSSSRCLPACCCWRDAAADQAL